MPDEKVPAAKKAASYQCSDDFVSRYSNNVFFETTVFDIKTVFGEFRQPQGKDATVEQHTAITMSWLEAKLAALFLAMNVAAHEKKFGVLAVPEAIFPPNFKSEEAKLDLIRLLGLIEQRLPLQPEEANDSKPVEVKQ